MDPATAKLSRHEPGPKLTPFASRRENHGGTVADSETILGSITIHAPLSEDVDDDEEQESSGTEESEEEEDFQMTTAPFAVESLVGSFTAGNPTFLYEAQSAVRRANGNSSFPVDEMEGAEAVDEQRISVEDEAVLEGFVPQRVYCCCRSGCCCCWIKVASYDVVYDTSCYLYSCFFSSNFFL